MSCSICRKDYNTIYKFQEDNSLRFEAKIDNVMTNSNRETHLRNVCIRYSR